MLKIKYINNTIIYLLIVTGCWFMLILFPNTYNFIVKQLDILETPIIIKGVVIPIITGHLIVVFFLCAVYYCQWLNSFADINKRKRKMVYERKIRRQLVKYTNKELKNLDLRKAENDTDEWLSIKHERLFREMYYKELKRRGIGNLFVDELGWGYSIGALSFVGILIASNIALKDECIKNFDMCLIMILVILSITILFFIYRFIALCLAKRRKNIYSIA